MRKTLLLGIGVGAALMYYCDPSWGRRRRAQLRERLERGVAHQVGAARVRAERASTRVELAVGPDEEDTDIDWTRGYSYRDRLAQSRGEE